MIPLQQRHQRTAAEGRILQIEFIHDPDHLTVRVAGQHRLIGDRGACHGISSACRRWLI
jgi:hypothetical protein